MAFLGIDLTKIEDQRTVVIPDGFYKGVITYAGVTEIKNGSLLIVRIQITEGPYANTRLKATMVQEHPNAVAVEIGKRRLKNLASAALIYDFITDSDELVGREIQFSTKTSEQYGTEAQSFYPLDYIPKPEAKTHPSSETAHPELDDDLPF
jgi:hypothetical protein